MKVSVDKYQLVTDDPKMSKFYNPEQTAILFKTNAKANQLDIISFDDKLYTFVIRLSDYNKLKSVFETSGLFAFHISNFEMDIKEPGIQESGKTTGEYIGFGILAFVIYKVFSK